MATNNNFSKIYGVKRNIYSNRFDEDDFKEWANNMREANDYGDEVTDDDLLLWYYDDLNDQYDDECDNLNEAIDGYIIALGRRWSHYGAICGNGRTGTRLIGDNLRDILNFKGDIIEFWTEDYNVNGRTADHDGCWDFTFRVCKSEEEAERLQKLAYAGKLDNSDIMARTKSLYSYIAKVYGWPYRGSKKAA